MTPPALCSDLILCQLRVFHSKQSFDVTLPTVFGSGPQAKGTLPAEVLDTQVDPAAFELSGHLVLKRAQDFDAVTQDFCWRLLECASLDEVGSRCCLASAYLPINFPLEIIRQRVCLASNAVGT